MALDDRANNADALLKEYGSTARLVIYLAAAPGAGKTRRLIEEVRRLRMQGRDAVLGWVDTKGRSDLERSIQGLPRIPARAVRLNERTFEDFDLVTAFERHPEVLALDEVAHVTLPGSPYANRWEEALALREGGISVLCAFNIAHLESVAPIVERLTGYPLRALVPDHFLAAADEVVALDVSPRLLRSRLRSGKIVQGADVDTALQHVFSEAILETLRELLLHAVDTVTVPNVSAERVSTAVAFVPSSTPIESYVERAAAVADALDLQLEVRPVGKLDMDELEAAAAKSGAELLSEPIDPQRLDINQLRASLIVLPNGQAARKLVNRSMERDIFVIDPAQTFLADPLQPRRLEDRPDRDAQRQRYGRLIVYVGAAAGCGKTYAMLDRAHQLVNEGVDVVAALIETHGRPETAAMIEDLEVLPRKIVMKSGIRYEELDRDGVIARAPEVALVDELAHTNAPSLVARKRYEDVLAILRAGIDVISTLNIQHLEGLNDTVFRLTQTLVRETLPDGILSLADEVILIDVSPHTLRQRLREGKIYSPERAERALSGFFTIENLTALRELALRETTRARSRERHRVPFERLLLCVGPRREDEALIRRCSQIAARLGVEFAVAMILEPRDAASPELIANLRTEAGKQNAAWRQETSSAAPRRIIELARRTPETVVAVAATLRRPRWPQRNAFARRILDAGARELIVLTRR
ncbi:MAG: hypothetical protein ACYDA5_08385 [Vulcanimicrobiaceae bacterium]